MVSCATCGRPKLPAEAAGSISTSLHTYTKTPAGKLQRVSLYRGNMYALPCGSALAFTLHPPMSPQTERIFFPAAVASTRSTQLFLPSYLYLTRRRRQKAPGRNGPGCRWQRGREPGCRNGAGSRSQTGELCPCVAGRSCSRAVPRRPGWEGRGKARPVQVPASPGQHRPDAVPLSASPCVPLAGPFCEVSRQDGK